MNILSRPKKWDLSKNPQQSFLFVLIFWALQVLLVVALIGFLGVDTPHGKIKMAMLPSKLIEILGSSDAGSYLSAASDLVRNSSNTANWQWVLNLWPPGMVWLDALLIRFSPIGFTWGFALILATVWGTALTLLVIPFVKSWLSIVVLAFCELFLLSMSPFQSWILDEGLFYADGIASGLILIALLILVNRTRKLGQLRLWFRDGVYIGICFAGAIFFRSSYQLLPWLLAATTGLLVLVAIFNLALKRQIRFVQHLVVVATATISLFLVMTPYTVYLQAERGRTNFVTTEDLLFSDNWYNVETGMPQWLYSSGASIGCDLDQEQCEIFTKLKSQGEVPSTSEYRDALVNAIAQHPIGYLENRIRYFSQQWIGDEVSSYAFMPSTYKNSDEISSSPWLNQNLPQGIAFFGLFLVTLFSTTVLVFKRAQISLIIIPLVVVAVLAPFAFVHIEVRYLIPLKMIALLAPILFLFQRQLNAKNESESGLQ